MRNLDVTTLRSFVAVADAGGVTRAAGFLNLTQSAVSMQLKRLEDLLDTQLLDRSNRRIALTPAGEKLLSHARRMVDLNDDVFATLTHHAFEGEIRFGVPHDVIYPVIPQVLQRFDAEYPRVKVHLSSLFTNRLKDDFARGEMDLILTTEEETEGNGERLVTLPLQWNSAPGGSAHKSRPLRIAFSAHCKFRPIAQRVLDAADIAWEHAVETGSDRTIEATVSADLAVTAALAGTEPPQLSPVPAGGGLPDLPEQSINMYVSETGGAVVRALSDMIRSAYAAHMPQPRLKSVS
ncbi:LysR family transcriptional regulator [Pseudaestuariivita atlantica]|uniref:LysR family transcriptional regulator n=1 Tax=Pseudaestuariivita atlantica TaxID=1317121 RepID=A0A0L1JLC9_9RHOB|nr:LysR family transcriptional regulator [Pseudaestuariivita atlantica]KNG92555.1 LysR family transcriptional regulator [Pseudaestuariivita atlantica]